MIQAIERPWSAKALAVLVLLSALSLSTSAQDKSARELEQLRQQRVAELQALVNSGNQSFQQGQYAAAESKYLVALEAKDPALPDEQVLIVYQNLANARYRQEDWLEAIEAYRMGQAEDALQLIAQCHIQLGNLIEAEQALRTVLVLYPDRTALTEQLAKLIDVLGKDEEAAEMYRKLLVQKPLDRELYRLLGGCLVSLGRTEAATDVLELAWRLGDHRPESARLLGDLYLSQEMNQEAAAYYQRYLSTAGGVTADDCFRLGFTYYQNGENVSARSFFTKAVELDAGYANAFLYLGHTATREGDLDLALREFGTALSHDDSLVAAHEAIGTIELGRGALEPAIASFERALELEGAEFSTHFNLIQTYLRLDRRTDAIAALKRAFRRYPNRPELRGLLEVIKRPS